MYNEKAVRIWQLFFWNNFANFLTLTQDFNMKIKTLVLFSIFALSMAMTGCMKSSIITISRLQDLNQDWKFILADPTSAEGSEFDDSQWRGVDLPFDWSTEEYVNQDSLHIGPFFKGLPGGADVGYLHNESAWYRKPFRLPRLNRVSLIPNFNSSEARVRSS